MKNDRDQLKRKKRLLYARIDAALKKESSEILPFSIQCTTVSHLEDLYSYVGTYADRRSIYYSFAQEYLYGNLARHCNALMTWVLNVENQSLPIEQEACFFLTKRHAPNIEWNLRILH